MTPLYNYKTGMAENNYKKKVLCETKDLILFLDFTCGETRTTTHWVQGIQFPFCGDIRDREFLPPRLKVDIESHDPTML